MEAGTIRTLLSVLLITAALIYINTDSFEPETLRGKRVLVTGASSGIGEEVAYHYARQGASVVVTARREHLLQKVVEKCRSLGAPDATFQYISRDLNNKQNAAYVVQGAVGILGGLDHIILNHAFIGMNNYWHGSADNVTFFERTMDVNFRSFVYVTSFALPHLKASRGSIAVVSSVAGKSSVPTLISYSSSKFALDGFFTGFRQEQTMRQSDVSITMCILGLIDTEQAQRFSSDIKGAMYAASAKETAWAIIRGTALKHKEVYYPRVVQIYIMFRDWLPGFFELITQMAISYIA